MHVVAYHTAIRLTSIWTWLLVAAGLLFNEAEVSVSVSVSVLCLFFRQRWVKGYTKIQYTETMMKLATIRNTEAATLKTGNGSEWGRTAQSIPPPTVPPNTLKLSIQHNSSCMLFTISNVSY